MRDSSWKGRVLWGPQQGTPKDTSCPGELLHPWPHAPRASSHTVLGYAERSCDRPRTLAWNKASAEQHSPAHLPHTSLCSVLWVFLVPDNIPDPTCGLMLSPDPQVNKLVWSYLWPWKASKTKPSIFALWPHRLLYVKFRWSPVQRLLVSPLSHFWAHCEVPPPASGALCLRSSAAKGHSAHMYSRSSTKELTCHLEQPSTDDSSKLEVKRAQLAATGENPWPCLLLVPQLQVSISDTRLAAQGRLTSFSIPVTSPLLYQVLLRVTPRYTACS